MIKDFSPLLLPREPKALRECL